MCLVSHFGGNPGIWGVFFLLELGFCPVEILHSGVSACIMISVRSAVFNLMLYYWPMGFLMYKCSECFACIHTHKRKKTCQTRKKSHNTAARERYCHSLSFHRTFLTGPAVHLWGWQHLRLHGVLHGWLWLDTLLQQHRHQRHWTNRWSHAWHSLR